MRKRCRSQSLCAGIVIVLLAGLGLSVWAAPLVSNVRASQRTDSSGFVDVYYDLSGASDAVRADIVFSNDNGQTWNVIPAPNLLSGDVGNGIANGSDKHIVWDAGRDRALVYWPQTKAKVRVAELGQTVTFQLPGNVPMEMVLIPAGSFTMGSALDPGYSESDEAPAHTVNIGYDFYMCKTEITQAQYYAIMGANPQTGGPVGPNYPVNSMTPAQIQAFLSSLNTLGLGTFRLPSEAEWEYACRAGTTTRFYWGDSTDSEAAHAHAWFDLSTGMNYPHPVGQLLPNAFGLYDMAGNVNEVCQDWYHPTYTGAPADGSAWMNPDGTHYVARGGMSDSVVNECRSANRGVFSTYNWSMGFRIVRTRN